jgi:long-chain acyl-CoA synthetase
MATPTQGRGLEAPPSGELSHGNIETVVGAFLARCRLDPKRVAFRHKRLGIWQETTWEEYYDRVVEVAQGLQSLGFAKGDRIAFMGDPRPEFLFLSLGAQALGGIDYGLYPTTSVEDLEYLLRHGGAKVFVAEDQEYIDKVLAIQAELPELEHLVVIDPRGMFDYSDPRIKLWSDLARPLGAHVTEARQWYERQAEEIRPEDISFIFYTSGTTGKPKGAMLTQQNVIWPWRSFFSVVRPVPGPKDRILIDLPLAHLGGRMFAMFLPFVTGCVPHFAEDSASAPEALREISPSMLFSTPRLWDKSSSQVLVGMETSSLLKRLAYKIGMYCRGVERKAAKGGKRPGLIARVVGKFGYYLVCRPILDQLGFKNVRLAVVGGAPVPPDLHEQWLLWGVNLKELYGMTEGGGVSTVQTGAVSQPGLAGKSLPGQEMRIAPDGEILFRGPNVFAGYWQDAEATAATLDEERWLHTGDVGEILPSGDLKVIDRQKNLLTLEDGRKVAPAEIENVIKGCPYVSDAVIIGEGKKYLAALVELDFDAVSEWARAHRIAYSSLVSLTVNPDVQKLISSEVQAKNASLDEKGLPHVKEVRIIPKELDPEAGDVTPTRKVKRSHIQTLFGSLIDDMYGSSLRQETDEPAKV